MPDGSVVSPDACWIAEERWDQLSADEQEGYASIVPDVIVEIASPSDAVADLKRKAERYRNYGASYVVVIDPFGREVTAYGAPPEGLALDAEAIFDP